MPPNGRTIELVYHEGCAGLEPAREALRRALLLMGREPVWAEWCTDHADCPDRLRGFPSPSILIGGRDVASGPDPDQPLGAACRLYPGPDGTTCRAPSLDLLLAALEAR